MSPDDKTIELDIKSKKFPYLLFRDGRYFSRAELTAYENAILASGEKDKKVDNQT